MSPGERQVRHEGGFYGWDIEGQGSHDIDRYMNHLPSLDGTCTPRSSAPITAVAWAPNGSLSVSGNAAGELTLWQDTKAVATAQVSWLTSVLGLYAFHPDSVLNGTCHS